MAERPTSGSLRLRLAVSLILSGAVMAAVLVFVFQTFARRIATEAQDSQLLASATSILESATIEADGLSVDLPYAALSMLGSVSEDRVFYQIVSNGEYASGYEGLVQPVATLAPRFEKGVHLGADIRVVTATRLIGSGATNTELTVSVAQTLEGMEARLARISRQAAGIGIGFFIFASALAFLVSRQALSPIDRLALSVARRGPKDLSPIQQKVPDELYPLLTSLNDFTSRLDRSLTRTEDFITESAHRIRTPLAIVRTRAELLFRRSEDEEDRATLRNLIHSVDESSRTAGQLLDHAMVNLRTETLHTVNMDLVGLLKDMVDRYRPVAAMRDVGVVLHTATPCTLNGDPILLEMALGNIIDNALKYAPPETDVNLFLMANVGQLTLRIEDAGPGFPAGTTEHLFDRFERGPSRDGTIGSGLGLTIARDVVLAHSGQINLTNTPQGGACVTLQLPR